MPECIHGKVVRLSDRVQRITAPNPSAMTGAGTNTYLLGSERIAVIDPGPLESSHVDAILDAVGERLHWIIATHTHPDHSPACAPLAEATGAPVYGMLASDTMFQDQTFVPDVHMAHDDCVRGDDFNLRTIHTPGHVDNHLCFLLEEEGMLFAGDHIMNGSTVVIVPPGGDMKAYIESLQLLESYPLQCIAPAHGDVMAHPMETVNWLVRHRLQRESKVIEQLDKHPQGIEELVQTVYNDVDAGLHGMAKLSLLAHLIKLEKDAVATSSGDGERQTWQLS